MNGPGTALSVTERSESCRGSQCSSAHPSWAGRRFYGRAWLMDATTDGVCGKHSSDGCIVALSPFSHRISASIGRPGMAILCAA